MSRRKRPIKSPPADFLEGELAVPYTPLPLRQDDAMKALISRKRKFTAECEKLPYYIVPSSQNTEFMTYRAVCDAGESRKKTQHNVLWDKSWGQHIQELMPRTSKEQERRMSHKDAKAVLQDIKANLENASEEDLDEEDKEEEPVIDIEEDDDDMEGDDYANAHFDPGDEDDEGAEDKEDED